jgi:hypothetical protein
MPPFGWNPYDILPETSTAITISIPFVVFVLLLISTVLGLKAMISELKASNLNTLKYGLNLTSSELFPSKPLIELILSIPGFFYKKTK